MMTKDFGMGFFGRMPFGGDRRAELFEKWSTMTDDEKLDFMNKRMEGTNDHDHGDCEHKREFSVEAIDKRCEEWMQKTPEEKEALVKEKKEMMENFRNQAHSFGHGRGFGFGGDDRREDMRTQMRDKWLKMTDEEKKEFIHTWEGMIKNGRSFFERFFSKGKEA